MSLLTSSNSSANEYLVRWAGSFIHIDGIVKLSCLLGDKDNTGLLIGHMGKYFYELLKILVNWDENLRINTDKDLSLLLRRLLVKILAWMATSDTLDDEFWFDLLDSWKPQCRLNSKRWFCIYFPV